METNDSQGISIVKQKHSDDTSLTSLKRDETLEIKEVEHSFKRRKTAIPLCKYGKDCYRKNPTHLKEYQHPSDLSPPAKKLRRSTSHETKSSDLSKVKNKHGSVDHKDKMNNMATTSKIAYKESKGNLTHQKSKYSSAKLLTSSTEQSCSSRKDVSIDKERSIVGLNSLEIFRLTKPLGFLLTKVTGIADMYNNVGALSLKEILSPQMGVLKQSAQFNYMFEISWMMDQYPVEFRCLPLLVVHGFQRSQQTALESDCKPFKNITACQAPLEIMYGTHHTKMMFLLYDTGLRVIIHTANLIERDWYQKTQGIWISNVFPRLAKASFVDGDSRTNFKRDLIEYVNAYNKPHLIPWINILKEHDMSSARVFIIGSVPGRHTGEKRNMYGHLKLKKVLTTRGPESHVVKGWPVVGQYSSIGSLGQDKNKWLCSEFLTSLSTTKGISPMVQSTTKALKLIYPSKHNVRLSLEGYPGGGSLPYSIETASKQRYLHDFFHQWVADVSGRSKALPHIKTYTRISPDSSKLAWFLVTSANLSKAAWGAKERDGVQQMIRSYEIGVLFLPQYFGKSYFSVGIANSNNEDKWDGTFPLPYDLPLTEYGQNDKPWIWNIPHVDKPDSHGNKWCPS